MAGFAIGVGITGMGTALVLALGENFLYANLILPISTMSLGWGIGFGSCKQ